VIGHALRRQLASGQGDRVGGQLIQVERLVRSFVFAQEDAAVFEHVAGAPDRLHDVLERLLDVRTRDRVPGEHAPRRLRVGEDDGQRLIEGMGQRVEQFPGHRDAGCLHQVMPPGPGLPFGTPSRRPPHPHSGTERGACRAQPREQGRGARLLMWNARSRRPPVFAGPQTLT
jgi:hypothetical protein